MIHRARYFESTNNLDENVHPPIFLRYAVCALGASLSETHSSKHESLYLSSRTYLQEAELRDQKMDKVEIAYAETWLLISMYEMIHAHFHRSWMSISRAVRTIGFLLISIAGCTQSQVIYSQDITELILFFHLLRIFSGG
jgi:hypothetical protein